MWRISNPSDSIAFHKSESVGFADPFSIGFRFDFRFGPSFSWVNTEVNNYSMHVCLCLRCKVAKRGNEMNKKTIIVWDLFVLKDSDDSIAVCQICNNDISHCKSVSEVKVTVMGCTLIVHQQISIHIWRVLIYKMCIRQKQISAGSITSLQRDDWWLTTITCHVSMMNHHDHVWRQRDDWWLTTIMCHVSVMTHDDSSRSRVTSAWWLTTITCHVSVMTHHDHVWRQRGQ